MADNQNPGNFANRPKEEVQAAAQKGGQTSTTGGFASMDSDKQVRNLAQGVDLFHIINYGLRKQLLRREEKHLADHSNQAVRKRRKLDARAVRRPRGGAGRELVNHSF